MFKAILAPTEGSDSERAALSVAVKLAQRFNADLRLVRVDSAPVNIEPVPQAPMLMVTDELIREERLARLHQLEALGTECRSLGDIRVITSLEDGPVGPALRDYANNFNVDLIVISSHARGGVRRTILGSVTDYLIRNTNIPVLVVKQPASFIGATPEETLSRILVPLDGSALAEQILPEVAEVALRLNSAVTLLRVLTPVTYSRYQVTQPGLPWRDFDMAKADASLARSASYLADKGLTVSQDVVLNDDVPNAIISYVARTGSDLIAIATSGSGGLSRFAFGTVADEVTRKSPCSLLVFHPKHVRSVVAAGESSVEETLAGVESVSG
jgi:nucleotide-binding universal stress UspA family protein